MREFSDKLVLVVEDNVVNQQVALLELQYLGMRADAVGNGNEAIEAISNIKYDLVLMDCQMPEMDGFNSDKENSRASVIGKIHTDHRHDSPSHGRRSRTLPRSRHE